MKVKTETSTVEVIDTGKRDALVAKHNKAFATYEAGTWAYAKVVYSIINSADFGKSFANIGDFAAAVGRDKGTISRLSRAYAMRESLVKSDNPKLADYFYNASASTVQEMVGLEEDDVARLIDSDKVVKEDSAKDVREVVNEFKRQIKTNSKGKTEDKKTSADSDKVDVTITVYRPNVSPDSDDVTYTTSLPTLTMADIRAIEKLLKKRGYGDVAIATGAGEAEANVSLATF